MNDMVYTWIIKHVEMLKKGLLGEVGWNRTDETETVSRLLHYLQMVRLNLHATSSRCMAVSSVAHLWQRINIPAEKLIVFSLDSSKTSLIQLSVTSNPGEQRGLAFLNALHCMRVFVCAHACVWGGFMVFAMLWAHDSSRVSPEDYWWVPGCRDTWSNQCLSLSLYVSLPPCLSLCSSHSIPCLYLSDLISTTSHLLLPYKNTQFRAVAPEEQQDAGTAMELSRGNMKWHSIDLMPRAYLDSIRGHVAQCKTSMWRHINK